MATKVISAFPGTGKSYFASHVGSNAKVVDLDSNRYTLEYADDGKVRSPDFPNNYVRAIQQHIGQADVLFVSCQPEVIAALRQAGIPFVLVYPERGLKAEYTERFRQRHNPQQFIDILSKNWDVFLDSLESQTGCKHIVLTSQQHISDIIAGIELKGGRA